MPETLIADAPTLRRIAFLVVRLAEDDETMRRPMSAISKVIEELKRDIVLGLPFDRAEVRRLCTLVHRLDRRSSKQPLTGLISQTVLAELDDLAASLCARFDGQNH